MFLFQAAFVLLPILGITWVFGLLAVNINIDVLYYLFAAFMLLQVSMKLSK